MKIFWIDPFARQEFGGAATWSMLLREHLPQHDHVVWAPEVRGRLGKFLYAFFDTDGMASNIGDAIRSAQPDLVHVNVSSLTRGAVLSGKPTVVNCHGTSLSCCGSKALNPFLALHSRVRRHRHWLLQANRVIVPSRYVAREISLSNALVIPHVPRKVVPDPQVKTDCELLFVGRAATEKGFQLFCNIPRRTKAAALLPGMVTPFNLSQCWTNAAPSVLSALYRQARLVVIPSTAPESFCYVAAEARVHGCRILTSQSGGIAEVLEGYPSATLLPANFSQAQLNAYVTPALQKEKSLESSPDLGAWAEQYNEVFRQITHTTRNRVGQQPVSMFSDLQMKYDWASQPVSSCEL